MLKRRRSVSRARLVLPIGAGLRRDARVGRLVIADELQPGTNSRAVAQYSVMRQSAEPRVVSNRAPCHAADNRLLAA